MLKAFANGVRDLIDAFEVLTAHQYDAPWLKC